MIQGHSWIDPNTQKAVIDLPTLFVILESEPPALDVTAGMTPEALAKYQRVTAAEPPARVPNE